MESNDELTICSVSFHSQAFLALNVELVARLNPDSRWRWVIADNSGELARTNALNDARCVILKGDAGDPSKPSWCRGSYQHARALNQTIGQIKTRWALFLDPDFFIVRPGWVNEVLAHMTAKKLGFFGVPWHPKWVIKVRYFPCVHCLFVDMNKVPKADLDFMPQLNLERGPTKEVKDRLVIGSSRDTGFLLYQRYGRGGKLRHEAATPVFRPRSEFLGPARALLRRNRLAEKLLPDRLCYVPKRPNAFTEVGFRELGYVDTTAHHWEEFVWQGRPWGFHVRGFMQAERDKDDELRALKQAIHSLTER